MTVDNLIAALDLKFPSWDVYRLMGKDWLVTVKAKGDQKFECSHSSLEEALRAALDWTPLPVIPRRPMAPQSEPVKRAGGWIVVDTLGYPMSQRYGTRRQASKALEEIIEHWSEADNLWLGEYGWSLEAREGLDYVTG
jgi:hypothetical protein